MQQLNDIFREWRIVDSKAANAEQAVERARQAQNEGKGSGPAPSQIALAKRLRVQAAELLEQAEGRSRMIESRTGRGKSREHPN